MGKGEGMNVMGELYLIFQTHGFQYIYSFLTCTLGPDEISFEKPLKINIKTRNWPDVGLTGFCLLVTNASLWRLSLRWQRCMLVAISEITEGEREKVRGRDRDVQRS